MSQRKCFRCGKVGHIQWYCESNEGEGSSEQGNEGAKSVITLVQSNPPFISHQANFAGAVQASAVMNVANSTAIKKAEEISEDIREVAWIVDSGATAHFASNKQAATNRRVLDVPILVSTASGDLLGKEIGDVTVEIGEGRVVNLKDVYLVEGLKCRLISVGKLDQLGVFVKFGGGKCVISTGAYNLVVNKLHGHYPLWDTVRVHAYQEALEEKKDESGEKMEERVKKKKTKCVDELSVLVPKKLDECAIGKTRKMKRGIHVEKEIDKNKQTNKLLHIELCGPFKETEKQKAATIVEKIRVKGKEEEKVENVISCKRFFKKKGNLKEKVVQFKSRLVGRGNRKQEGVDNKEINIMQERIQLGFVYPHLNSWRSAGG